MGVRIPNGSNLMNQFDLESGGPRTTPHPEPMERFLVADGGGEALIDN